MEEKHFRSGGFREEIATWQRADPRDLDPTGPTEEAAEQFQRKHDAFGTNCRGFCRMQQKQSRFIVRQNPGTLFCPRKIRRLNTCGYRTPLTFDPGKWNTQDTVLEAGRLKHATVGSLVFTNEKTGPELLWRVIFLHLDFTVMPKSNKQGGVRSGPSEGGLNGGLCSGSEVEFD